MQKGICSLVDTAYSCTAIRYLSQRFVSASVHFTLASLATNLSMMDNLVAEAGQSLEFERLEPQRTTAV